MDSPVIGAVLQKVAVALFLAGCAGLALLLIGSRLSWGMGKDGDFATVAALYSTLKPYCLWTIAAGLAVGLASRLFSRSTATAPTSRQQHRHEGQPDQEPEE